MSRFLLQLWAESVLNTYYTESEKILKLTFLHRAWVQWKTHPSSLISGSSWRTRGLVWPAWLLGMVVALAAVRRIVRVWTIVHVRTWQISKLHSAQFKFKLLYFDGATQFRCWGDTTSMLGRRNLGWGDVTWGNKAMGRHNLTPFAHVVMQWNMSAKFGIFFCF